MDAATYGHLLRDLQRLEKRLCEAHLARARSEPALMARVARRHALAEVGGRVDDYAALCARKAAVQLLLRTVYIRVLEDLDVLSPARLRGDWGLAAFREVAPALGTRRYLAFVFDLLAADFPALFTPGPEEVFDLPSEDLCREVYDLWHHPNREGVVYGWRGSEAEGAAAPLAAPFDSRFLGDLYQDLDAEVRKRYALLQTPDFVELKRSNPKCSRM